MNSITAAFKQAGAPVPVLTKRVWLWLKDHPERTYSDIAIELGETIGAVSSTLSNMNRRGMVRFIEEPQRPGGIRTVRRYSVTQRIYELLPCQAKGKKAPPVAPVTVALVHKPPPLPEWTPESVVDKLNVRQARAVFDTLKGIFFSPASPPFGPY